MTKRKTEAEAMREQLDRVEALLHLARADLVRLHREVEALAARAPVFVPYMQPIYPYPPPIPRWEIYCGDVPQGGTFTLTAAGNKP